VKIRSERLNRLQVGQRSYRRQTVLQRGPSLPTSVHLTSLYKRHFEMLNRLGVHINYRQMFK